MKLFGILALPFFAYAQTDVLNYHNDVARTGLNSTETTLTPSNVDEETFGKLWSFATLAKVDAQPLVVTGLSFPGRGTHDTLFIATERDTVFAVDAVSGTKLWRKSLLLAGETPSDEHNCTQVFPTIGITSTPVVMRSGAPGGGTLYAVAYSKDTGGNYHFRLHGLTLTSGAEVAGSPVEITATYPGNGPQSVNGVVTFNPAQHKQRSALLLANNVIYIGFASHCDRPPYTGWMMGYSATTLQPTAVLNVTANGAEGAFWASGGGPALDTAGNLYMMVANGTFDKTLNAQGFPAKGDFGNSLIKMRLTGNTLAVTDYFAPYTAAVGATNETIEPGSGGIVVLPDMTDANGNTRHLAVGTGKDANVYILDRDNMGKYNSSNNNGVYQEVTGVLGPGGDTNKAVGAVRMTPCYFNGMVYFAANLAPIQAFRV